MMQDEIGKLLAASMENMAARFERNGEAYPYIDTKFDIVSGRDFGENDEPFRRKECIYSWIQGRGIESLAKHAAYFAETGNAELAAKLTAMLETVVPAMEELRRKNGGRLPFAMRPDGTSFFRQESGHANYSDLFYGKGLLAAGKLLDRPELTQEGEKLFTFVLDGIEEGSFHTDQQSFDPKNKVAFVAGKFPQGPAMIALSGLADQIAVSDDPRWSERTESFISDILEFHVNLGQYPDLQEFDFIESLDNGMLAWREADGSVFCDPGHALEFVGHAGKCLLAMQKKQLCPDLVAEGSALLPPLFCHVFDYGFNGRAGGICKGFNLTARKVLNGDMPWWNLPETVRAGMELMILAPEQAPELSLRTGRAFQAFMQGFLQSSGFGCQTRSETGEIIQVIPAVSDADPGYHTNLALIDVLKLMKGNEK